MLKLFKTSNTNTQDSVSDVVNAKILRPTGQNLMVKAKAKAIGPEVRPTPRPSSIGPQQKLRYPICLPA